MADKADQALKLAQKLEKDLKAFKKSVDDWEKKQTDWVEKVQKNLVDGLDKQDKKLVDLHNQQSKKLNEIISWVEKNFDKKGLF